MPSAGYTALSTTLSDISLRRSISIRPRAYYFVGPVYPQLSEPRDIWFTSEAGAEHVRYEVEVPCGIASSPRFSEAREESEEVAPIDILFIIERVASVARLEQGTQAPTVAVRLLCGWIYFICQMCCRSSASEE